MSSLAQGTSLRLWAVAVALLAGLGASLAGGFLASAPPVASTPPAAVPRPALDAHGDPLPPHAIARLGTLRFRPGSWVSQLHFTPDGKRLVSFDTGCEVVVWDAATGRPIARRRLGQLGEHAPGYVAKNGESAVTLGWQEWGKVYQVRRYALPDFRVIGEFDTGLRTGRDEVKALSPDGTILAGAFQNHGADHSIELYDVTEGKKLRSWHALPCAIRCLVFSADGKSIATGGEDKVVRIWDVATGAKRFESDKMPLPVWQLAVSDDGRAAVAVGMAETRHATGQWTNFADYHAYLWEVPGRKPTHRLAIPAFPIQGWALTGFSNMRFAPDGKTLFTGGSDGVLRFWDVKTGKQLQKLPHGEEWRWIGPCDFSPDGKTLAFIKSGIRLIDVASCKEVVTAPGPMGQVSAPVVTPDARTVVTLGDGAATFWDTTTGRSLGQAGRRGSPLKSARLLPDGRTALGQDEERSLRWLDLATRNETRRLRLGVDAGELIAVSPDGKTAAVGKADGQAVALIDLSTSREVGSLPHAGAWRDSAVFTPDGRNLVTWSRESKADFWDLKTLKRVRSFSFAPPPPETPIAGEWRKDSYNAVLSPNGRRVAYGHWFGYLAIHDVETGRALHVVPGVMRSTHIFAFTPDGRTLARTTQYGATVQLLEVATGKERLRLEGHAGQIQSLVFAADGRTLVSGSEDSTALVWDVLGGGAKGEVEACWADLADADAARAFQTMRRLLRSPAEAVALLAKGLKPAPVVVTDARLKALIADLDSEVYATREAARLELERAGDAASGALGEALAASPPLEKRRRLERLVQALAAAESAPPPERLRLSRALEVLERIPGSESRGLLEKLAGGARGAWLTREAAESLARHCGR